MIYEDGPIVTAMSIKMRATIVSYPDGVLAGELHSVFLKEPYRFSSLIKMINKMEDIFDKKRFPMAFLRSRKFTDTKRSKDKQEFEGEDLMMDNNNSFLSMPEEDGSRKCTFEISVRYRQNASWQGDILWADKNLKQNFRSVLEMLKLMDEALSDGGAGSRPIKWDDEGN